MPQGPAGGVSYDGQVVAVPRPTKVLVGGAVVLAIALLWASWSAHRLAEPLDFMVLMVAALLCGARTVRVSDALGTVSVGSVVVFVAVLRLGTPEACIAGALTGLAAVALSPERHRRPPAVIVFAMATVVLTAWVAGAAFSLCGGSAEGADLGALALPAAAGAASCYLLNALLVGTAAHLTSGLAPTEAFATCLRASVVPCVAGGGLALLVHLGWHSAGAWVCLVAAPAVYLLYLATARHASPETADDARR